MSKLGFQRSALASAIVSVLFASGCGGGGGGNNGSTSGTTVGTSSLSGVVADGYLVGATVCLDVNGNRACDADEPQATTTTGGAYTLEGVQDSNFPVLVEVSAATVDEDTGTAVGAPYVLIAPAGEPGFISPLTTMVQTQLEGNPDLSVEEAENVIKAGMGYAADSPVDLFTDYVAAKADPSNPDTTEYERLHKVAQVTAQVLENNFNRVRQAAVAAGLDPASVLDSLVSLLAKEVIAQLDAIAQQVDDPGFDVDGVASSTVGMVDTGSIADDVAAEELASNVAVTSLQDILTNGINWVEAEDDTPPLYEYGRIGLNAAGDTTIGTDLEYDGSTFATPVTEDRAFVLGPSGWVEVSDGASDWSVTFNSDNSATIGRGNGADSERVTASSLDVSGQPIRSFLNGENALFGQAIPAAAVFSPGATAYRWSFTQVNDLYWFEVGADFCSDPGATGGNCNAVGLSGTPATQLSELISDSAFVDDGTNFLVAPLIGFDGSPDRHLMVEFVGTGTQGTTNFYVQDNANTNSNGVPAISKLASGTWSMPTVSGEDLLVFDIPGTLVDRTFDDDSSRWFYAVQNGFVRQGLFFAAGTVDEFVDGWNFNDIGLQAILDNFTP